jgi:GNAT superfamily N-acetyltransferase
MPSQNIPAPGSSTVEVRRGFAPEHRPEAARLFWNAFSGKLGKILGPDEKALAFVKKTLDPDFAFAAVSKDGNLLGLAGYKTSDGAFAGGSLLDLTRVYGYLGGLWRGLVLELIERDLESGALLMDGIFVHPDARGQGVGTLLLEEIIAEAKRRGAATIASVLTSSTPTRVPALFTSGSVSRRYLRKRPAFLPASSGFDQPREW